MADDNSSGMTAIVAIIAIIVILGLGYVVMRNLNGAPANGGGATIDVDLPVGGNSSN